MTTKIGLLKCCRTQEYTNPALDNAHVIDYNNIKKVQAQLVIG